MMEFLSSDPFEILQIIFEYDHLFYGLKNHYLKAICARPKSIFSSEKFLLLEEEVIYTIFDQENLNIEEIKVWDRMIEWGIAKNSELAYKDISKWTEGDFVILKRTL